MKSIVLGPGESRAIAGHPARIKASSEDCDERFCVLESTIGPGEGPVMHLHRRHVETHALPVDVDEMTRGCPFRKYGAGSRDSREKLFNAAANLFNRLQVRA